MNNEDEVFTAITKKERADATGGSLPEMGPTMA